jgi:hypothetical protein
MRLFGNSHGSLKYPLEEQVEIFAAGLSQARRMMTEYVTIDAGID